MDQTGFDICFISYASGFHHFLKIFSRKTWLIDLLINNGGKKTKKNKKTLFCHFLKICSTDLQEESLLICVRHRKNLQSYINALNHYVVIETPNV